MTGDGRGRRCASAMCHVGRWVWMLAGLVGRRVVCLFRCVINAGHQCVAVISVCQFDKQLLYWMEKWMDVKLTVNK